MRREAWLVYDSIKPIKVDREKIASACQYFEHLLEGNFKESKQYCININIGNMFSYSAFDCIVRFANDGFFSRDPQQWPVHLEAIQLAIIWDYREFIDLAESFLIEQLHIDTLLDLSTLAVRHRNDLAKLHKACDDFAENMNNGIIYGKWARCSFKDHPKHHLISCMGHEQDNRDSDWDDPLGDF